jgi:hypothetical protein
MIPAQTGVIMAEHISQLRAGCNPMRAAAIEGAARRRGAVGERPAQDQVVGPPGLGAGPCRPCCGCGR